MSEQVWREGNELKIMENGEEFFTSVFDDIGKAQREVLIETFIIYEDAVGTQLKQVLIAAARRGLRVELTADGYGSADLSDQYIQELISAGVHLTLYDPKPKWLGLRTNLFRRLHRKIVVVDQGIAHVGGINFSHDHLLEHGPEAKQDYSLRIVGPLVADIHAFTLSANGLKPLPLRERLHRYRWSNLREQLLRWRAPAASSGNARAMLVTRDNDRHRRDIERQYRTAIRQARREIIIANAYFFPGYRFLRELQSAARRGVAVHILIQGRPDIWIVQFAATTLYSKLLGAGVKLHEYSARPMHAKVATIDHDWVTIGSSNLDPLSLYLNLECNVVARDPALNADLRARLHHLIQHSSRTIPPDLGPHRTLWRQLLSALAFSLMRRFPSWAGWLPAHTPRLQVHARKFRQRDSAQAA